MQYFQCILTYLRSKICKDQRDKKSHHGHDSSRRCTRERSSEARRRAGDSGCRNSSSWRRRRGGWGWWLREWLGGGGEEDVEVELLTGETMAGNAAKEKMVAVVGECDWVVSRGEGGDWVWGVAASVHWVRYSHYVVELWVVFEHCQNQNTLFMFCK